MKTLINEVDGYRLYADITSINEPADYKFLKITSQWDNAKAPNQEQKKFEMLMSPAALAAFKNFIKEA